MRQYAICGALLVAVSGQAASAQPGGRVSLGFGNNFVDAGTGGIYDTLNYSSVGVEAAFGGEFDDRTGWQLDLTWAQGTYSDGDPYGRQAALVGHLFTAVGEWDLGAFLGTGTGTDSFSGGDTATLTWGGVEVAREFDQHLFAAQLGTVSATNTVPELNFSRGVFGAVQLRHLVNDDLMITGNLSYTWAQIDIFTLSQAVIGVEAMYRLGQSDFFGTLGVRRAFMANPDSLPPASGGETRVELGLTFLFGGGDLRDSYGTDTRMISRQDLTWFGINTSIFN